MDSATVRKPQQLVQHEKIIDTLRFATWGVTLDFCQKNYGVSFPLFDKVDVKGESICQVFQFLTQKELNGVEDSEVSWNFNKYLIDENGKYVKHYKSGVEPNDPLITDWIEGKK